MWHYTWHMQCITGVRFTVLLITKFSAVIRFENWSHYNALYIYTKVVVACCSGQDSSRHSPLIASHFVSHMWKILPGLPTGFNIYIYGITHECLVMKHDLLEMDHYYWFSSLKDYIFILMSSLTNTYKMYQQLLCDFIKMRWWNVKGPMT